VVVVARDDSADTWSVNALDGGGHQLEGWPWSMDTGSSAATVALGPDGSIYAAVSGLETADFAYTHSLHRLSPEGQDAAGFPVGLPDAGFCGLQSSSAGIAYVACEVPDANGDVTSTVLTAVRPDGSPAFPAITFPGEASLLGFASDAQPMVAIPAAKSTVIRALAADGATSWSSATIPGDAQIDRDGRIRVTRHQFQPDACGAPTRTSYDLLNPDGSRPAGWPFTVGGWSSVPAVLGDGSMVVVTSDGRATRRALGGTVMAGWPIRGIDVSYGCNDGSTPVTDGRRIAVVGSQRVTLLGSGGRVLPGWPANPPGVNANACPGCTPGSGATIEPILGEGPVTYVATYDANDRPRVAAIDAGGSVQDQVVVGDRGAQTLGLDQSPDGHVWAVTTLDRSDSSSSTLSLVAAPPAAP
jgi:hypothetical protein